MNKCVRTGRETGHAIPFTDELATDGVSPVRGEIPAAYPRERSPHGCSRHLTFLVGLKMVAAILHPAMRGHHTETPCLV